MWPGHHMMAGHTPAAFERRAFFTTERGRSGIGIGVQPRAVVGRHDDDRVGRVGADFIHDLADVGIESPSANPNSHPDATCREIRRRIGRVVHLDEVDIHEERLVALRVLP